MQSKCRFDGVEQLGLLEEEGSEAALDLVATRASASTPVLSRVPGECRTRVK